MTTTEKVREILVTKGEFRELPNPLKVGSQTFSFPHAFIGGEKSNDLVIIVELNSGTKDAEVVRKLFALTRALDVLRSRRSVTVVLTLGQPLPDTLRSLGRVCRVLAIGSPNGPSAGQVLHDWLSVLLPLNLPAVSEETAEWEAAVYEELAIPSNPDFVQDLLHMANEGEKAVQMRLKQQVSRAVMEPLEENQGTD
jgi:hypothetical protein